MPTNDLELTASDPFTRLTQSEVCGQSFNENEVREKFKRPFQLHNFGLKA